MDGKWDFYCRIAADVLFVFGNAFSSCLVIYAALLVWMADRRDLGCDPLYFYTDRGVERHFVWFLPDHHAEQPCNFAHWYLLVIKCRIIACGPCGLEKKNVIEELQ